MKQAADPHGLLAAGHRQPDQLSCGTTAGVLAAALLDAPLAESLRTPDVFTHEVLLLHRRLTGPHGADGRAQLPWPRALGTPPWGLQRHLTLVAERPYRTRLLRGPSGRRVRAALLRALEQGAPAAVYVGNALMPRHVLLAVPRTVPGATRVAREPGAVALYDPATGRVRSEALGPDGSDRLTRGWPVPWLVVLPRDC